MQKKARAIKVKEKTQKQIDEAYQHIKPYLSDINETKELREMCKHCERYCGKNHNYEECLDMQCFKFYLAYQYLEWCNSY